MQNDTEWFDLKWCKVCIIKDSFWSNFLNFPLLRDVYFWIMWEARSPCSHSSETFTLYCTKNKKIKTRSDPSANILSLRSDIPRVCEVRSLTKEMKAWQKYIFTDSNQNYYFQFLTSMITVDWEHGLWDSNLGTWELK